ncbi:MULTISPECIES: hypothetical protein [unclassified Corynebacterium]|uniref:hypothetical protein n=1 Tax=unclassified Corynebacterium TaxID=2624378 RepID=UPI0029CA7103|nr:MULTISPECIES: hypothetical protein [unclassified Corynebacterium]WPF66242.1 hypothetical protein OLX12_00455 [Corynebacterium sp. 22KM0430]WPF68732.1 hypothetical protein OLW90_00455 [Corynebacterium sp. 21KM1197]
MTQKNQSTLNATRTRRLGQAAFVGAWEALPDYVPSRVARGVIKTALVGGGVATAVALGRGEDTPVEKPKEIDLSATQTRVALAVGFALLVAMPVLNHKIRVWAAGWLRRCGINRPHTVLGVAAAVVVFAALESEADVA